MLNCSKFMVVQICFMNFLKVISEFINLPTLGYDLLVFLGAFLTADVLPTKSVLLP